MKDSEKLSHTLDLLAKAKALPVGTIRKWGGKEYIKHQDGWVAVGGKNHGKLTSGKKMSVVDNHPNASHHAAHADTHKIKGEIEETKAKVKDIDDKQAKVKDLQEKKDQATANREDAEKKVAESKAKVKELKSKLKPKKKKKTNVPTSRSAAVQMFDDAGVRGDLDMMSPTDYYIEIDRYRRHDHGGGEDGDDWMDDSEIDKDYKRGVKEHKSKLDAVNKELKKRGFEPNATFDLGEKGHFAINVNLRNENTPEWTQLGEYGMAKYDYINDKGVVWEGKEFDRESGQLNVKSGDKTAFLDPNKSYKIVPKGAGKNHFMALIDPDNAEGTKVTSKDSGKEWTVTDFSRGRYNVKDDEGNTAYLDPKKSDGYIVEGQEVKAGDSEFDKKNAKNDALIGKEQEYKGLKFTITKNAIGHYANFLGTGKDVFTNRSEDDRDRLSFSSTRDTPESITADVKKYIDRYVKDDVKKSDEAVTPEEKGSVEEYKKGLHDSAIGGFTAIQGVLRDGKVKFGDVSPKQVKPYIDHLSSAVSKSPLPKATKLHRGMNVKVGDSEAEAIYNLKAGDTYSDKAFMSATSSTAVANRFAEKLNNSDKQVKMVFDLPEGHGALKVADHLPGADKEKEFILDKGGQYEVHKVAERSGVKTITLRPKGMKKSEDLIKALDMLAKGKKVPVGTVHNGMKKIAEGKWEPVKEGSSANPKERADENQSNHHADEAGRHMSEASKHMDIANRLEAKIKDRQKIDPDYKVPAEAQKLLDESKSKAKAHAEDYKSKKEHATDAKSDVEATQQDDSVKETKSKASDKNKNAKLEEGASEKASADDKQKRKEASAKKDEKAKVEQSLEQLDQHTANASEDNLIEAASSMDIDSFNDLSIDEVRDEVGTFFGNNIKNGFMDIDDVKEILGIDDEIAKGRMQIAMQDHEGHEQYRADKPKEGIEADPNPQVEKADKKAQLKKLAKDLKKGGEGSGKKGHTTVQDHKDQAEHHYDKAQAYSEMHSKMQDKLNEKLKEDRSYKMPANAQKLMDIIKQKKDNHLKEHKNHRSQSAQNWKPGTVGSKLESEKLQTQRAGEAQDNVDKLKQDRKKDFGKSLIQADEQGSAIDTADQMIELNEALKDNWYLQFKGLMDGYDYGDAPRTLDLDGGYSIILSKVDDGLYSGFVKQTVDWDGESQLEETACKLEKQTLSSIIAFLKAKEYIDPSVGQLDEMIEESQEVEHFEVEVPTMAIEPQVDRSALAEKLINLLDRLV
tara:strand:+ start:2567 stop:6298 length:3732 start_codon:yes stop_codon:yes gene_type:complete